jgi:hypothetical protein
MQRKFLNGTHRARGSPAVGVARVRPVRLRLDGMDGRPELTNRGCGAEALVCLVHQDATAPRRVPRPSTLAPG